MWTLCIIGSTSTPFGNGLVASVAHVVFFSYDRGRPTCRLRFVFFKRLCPTRDPNQIISRFVGFIWRRFDQHRVYTAPTPCSMFEIATKLRRMCSVNRPIDEYHQRGDDFRRLVFRSRLVHPRCRSRTPLDQCWRRVVRCKRPGVLCSHLEYLCSTAEVGVVQFISLMTKRFSSASRSIAWVTVPKALLGSERSRALTIAINSSHQTIVCVSKGGLSQVVWVFLCNNA